MDVNEATKSALPPDDREIRCPRLGGQVTFSYCRREASGKPCFKALDCWYEFFDAEAFFRRELGDEMFEKIFLAPPKPRLVTLVDLIEQATKTLKNHKNTRDKPDSDNRA